MARKYKRKSMQAWRAIALSFAIAFGLYADAESAKNEIMPQTQGHTLTGTSVSLPFDAHGRSLVLVFGFHKSAREQSTVWGKELLAWQQQGLAFDFYQVPMLAAAPRFTHGLIARAMKASMPSSFKRHTLILSSDEEEWNDLIKPGNKDDVYVMLCDGSGKIIWRTSGAERSQVQALKAHLQ